MSCNATWSAYPWEEEFTFYAVFKIQMWTLGVGGSHTFYLSEQVIFNAGLYIMSLAQLYFLSLLKHVENRKLW